MIKNIHSSSHKVPVILSDFTETLIFLTYFSKNIQIRNFTKIHLVGAELFHVARQWTE